MTEILHPDELETLIECSTLGNFDLSRLAWLLRQADERKIEGEAILHQIMGAEISKFLGDDFAGEQWVIAFNYVEFPLRSALADVYLKTKHRTTDPVQRREQLLKELSENFFPRQVERARQTPIERP